MEKDKKKTLIVILIMVILTIGVISLSYAFFTSDLGGQETTETITVAGGIMDITFTGGKIIELNNIIPDNNPAVSKTFTVVGNNTTKDLTIEYSILLIVEENTFSDEAISYTLDSVNSSKSGITVPSIENQIKLTSGTNAFSLGDGRFTNGINKVHTYTLNIYFPDTGENQNMDQGKTFKAYIGLEGGELSLVAEAIDYTPIVPTDKEVTVKITANRDITILGWSCSGRVCTKKYSENKIEQVRMIGTDEVEVDVRVSVNNIISEELVAGATLSTTNETLGPVVVTLTANRDITVHDWQCEANICTKSYSENTNETVIVKDDNNITREVNLSITNIVLALTGTTWNYTYTGNYQTFTAPANGNYKIELWGAGLAGSRSNGSYVRGEIALTKTMPLYLYIGAVVNTFNGGGSGYTIGNGATDVRLESGNWDNNTSLSSRVIVAGAGGNNGYTIGSSEGIAIITGNYGYAGGLIGYEGSYNYHASYTNYVGYPGAPGSQTDGGNGGATAYCGASGTGVKGGFGKGGAGGTGCIMLTGYPTYNGIGGAGGYYGSGGSGGSISGMWSPTGTGGGSSYISGHTGCVAIKEKNDQTPKAGCTTGTTNNSCSIHYSGMIFTNTLMIDGAGYSWSNVKSSQVQMPNLSGNLYALGTGHAGNGYIRITFLG